MTAPRTRTLPATDYWDPQVHETERTHIFGRAWLCLGPSTDVASPGCYRAESVAGWPLVVVRDDDGHLRAFHNVCRHRAGPLVDDGCGTCRSFICRYHGWSYELDGRLRSARDSGLSAVDLEGIDLLEVRADLWRGLLFVNLDPGAPPVGDWLHEGFRSQCETFPMEEWLPAARRTHPIACNWKTYSDNYLEGYHIPFVHPGLARAIDTSSYEVHVGDGWIRHAATPRQDASTSGVWLYHWPNLALNLYASGMSVERWTPTAPTGTDLVIDYRFADPTTADSRRDVDASTQTCLEDKAICEAVQRNLEAGAYVDGLLAPRHEAGLADFQARIRAARDVDTVREA